ncbi:MAG TPA: 50S ribosomal protein L20 [Thermoflexales bacterium]|nr:50S ribosomal protein L20 [Thermoflexales bacterium]HQW35225.1 50S ribosomal protein L20 [Thermoflexales bacterium]HQZ21884.1 50S ribosomal protein L20 [Thermoflexales bacterium]HRA00133.1 50S ribosomal protein L20 [Thermoflexales bacterium]
MARVKGGVKARRRHNRLLEVTKGHFGAKHKHVRKATESKLHSLSYATIDRRLERREIRKLWILRINAAARLNGTTYSKLIAGLKAKGIELNRKSLAELAAREPDAFATIVKQIA